jgi:glycosyltransferase involved in cell wall biosynthesis
MRNLASTTESTAGGVQEAPGLKDVLILAHDFPPTNSPGAVRMLRFARYLPEFGFAAHVVTASSQKLADDRSLPPCDTIVRVPNGSAPAPQVAVLSHAAEIAQRWLLPYNESLPWVPLAVAASRHVLATKPNSIIFSSSPPISAHFAALWLKRRYGLRWVADFRDPVFENPFRNRQFTGPYNAALQAWFIRRADVVLTVTDVVGEAWCAQYRKHASKIHILWNGFDPEEALGPAPIPPRDQKIMTHVGSVYGNRHPGLLLGSLKRLMHSDILKAGTLRVRLLGDVDETLLKPAEDPAASLIHHGGLEYENRIVPHSEALGLMSAANFLLLLDGNTDNRGYTVPAKLFEYVRIGRPILAFTAQGSPVERILSRSGVPYQCVYHNDAEDRIDAKVLALISMPSSGTTPSEWFTREFNGRSQAATLARILDGLSKPQ